MCHLVINVITIKYLTVFNVVLQLVFTTNRKTVMVIFCIYNVQELKRGSLQCHLYYSILLRYFTDG